jgi:hypothetical protein
MERKKTIDNQKFKRFFFYGIENKREAKEGIIYFSSNKVYQKYTNSELYIIPNEQIENEIIQEASKKYKQFYRFVTLNDTSNNYTLDVSIEELKKELEEEMQLLRKEKKIIDTSAGIFFTRDIEEKLNGGQYYVYGEGLKGEDGWTKQIYDILDELEKMEKIDNEKYYKYWILTKLSRAIDRHDEQEAIKVKQIYEDLEKKEIEIDER